MESGAGDPMWYGSVAQARGAAAPGFWLNLDPSTIFRGLPSGNERSFVLEELQFPLEPAGLFEGMHAALCLPLELEGRRFGVALLAARRPRLLSRRAAIENLASEIAGALSLGTARRACLVANRALQLRADLDRAIAGNASTEEILRLIATSAVRNTEAEFAGIGRVEAGAFQWTALAGSESQAAGSYPALLEVANAVLAERQPAIRSHPSGANPSVWLAGVPLEQEDSQSLLLLAGYRSEGEVPLDSLRQFAIAAVAALRSVQAAIVPAQPGTSESERLAAELRSVLEATQCGVLLLDLGGTIRHSNARFGDFLGLEARPLDSAGNMDSLSKLVRPGLRNPEVFLAPWKDFCRGSRTRYNDELSLAGREPRVLVREARPVLAENGVPLGWLELYRDITSLRQMHAKLLQTEKMAALGQLVSGIAHELNNPLTSIMGYAQLLLGRAAPDAPGGEAKMIFEEAERARRIVKNLLFFARKAEPERTRADINEIVERTVSLRGYELKVENIAVTANLAPDLPATLADPFQLQQVVLNLLVNAEQAILEGRGHGRIEIRTRKVSPLRLAIEVSDDGPGVPAEIASRIFDPFFTTKAPGVGTGLGLSIVYGIIEQHGGEVTFENQRGGGAKFTLELPVVALPATASEPAPEVALHPVNPSAARVLVVEDEPTVARLVADVLREEGHKVEAVLDSQEGLARISRGSFDLIICDLRMPRLDGPAFYDALVRAGSPARHRILFITGDTLGPRTVEFLKSRKLPFLAKPFLVEELKLSVNRVLQRGANAEAAEAVGTRAL